MESWEQERKQIIREHRNLNATQLRGLLSARLATRQDAEEKVKAAAPELLEALEHKLLGCPGYKKIYYGLDGHSYRVDCPDCVKAQEAITKAQPK